MPLTRTMDEIGTSDCTISSAQLPPKDGKEWFPCLQRPGRPGEDDTRVLPVLLLRLDKSPHPEQPHPDAPAPHFGLWDEGLFVCDSQLQSHVEACCLPWTQHFGANRGEQKEMNTGTYPYFTLNHRLSQPVIPFSHQLYGVIPITSPERNCDEFLKKKVKSRWVNHNQDTEDLLLICRNQDAEYLLFILTRSA